MPFSCSTIFSAVTPDLRQRACPILAFRPIGFSMSVYAEGGGKVNINTAGGEELASLYKVGENYAQRFVEYREKNGEFEKAEDVVKVKGIGSKIWEANKDRIVVE